MIRMALTAATRLLHNGLNLRLVEQRGDDVDWACDRTKRRFTFTHAELADMIGRKEAGFERIGASGKDESYPDPDSVDPARRADAELRLAYVLDMHEKGLTHRPKLIDFEKQIQATAADKCDPTPPEAWTVKRWLKRCGPKPHWRQLLERTEHKGNRGLRVTDDQRALIDRQIDERYLKRPPISVEDLQPHVRNAIRVANLSRPADDKIDNVGRDAILSVIARRDPKAVHAARYGALAARDKFDRVTAQIDAEAPLDRIEIDHTRADLFVVSDTSGLPIGRPNIGFAIDRCTRMPFGLYIGFEPESVLSVMQILKNGVFPKTYVRQKIDTGEWDLKHDWPVWGMPRGLVFDRGMAGLSHDLRQAALELGIRDVMFTSAKSGRQKGAVERFFRTQNQKLLHRQRGTSFSNVVQRDDYDPRKNAIIPFSDLLKMAHRYLIDIYARDPHGGLDGRPPVRVWEETIDKHPSDPVMSMDRMLHLFTRSKTVMLRREGVRLHSLFYNSDELDAERGSADFAAKCPRGNVLMRYDPADLGAVWVRLPHRDGRYLRVPLDRKWRDYATGKSVWEHLQIRAHHVATRVGEWDPDDAAESEAMLVADSDEAHRKQKKTATATRRARMEGVGRTSPAGSDHRTTPAGSGADRQNNAAKAKRPKEPANDVNDAGTGQRPPKPSAATTGIGTGRIKKISLGASRKPPAA